MLLLPSPKKLMLGYWLGAMTMSITVGLVIVFALKNSSLVHTAKHTILLVLIVNAIALLLLELPLISFTVAPSWTPTAIERAKVLAR